MRLCRRLDRREVTAFGWASVPECTLGEGAVSSDAREEENYEEQAARGDHGSEEPLHEHGVSARANH